jgi:hypothetical protein
MCQTWQKHGKDIHVDIWMIARTEDARVQTTKGSSNAVQRFAVCLVLLTQQITQQQYH